MLDDPHRVAAAISELSAKLAALDLTDDETAVLDSIFERAAANDEVAGFAVPVFQEGYGGFRAPEPDSLHSIIMGKVAGAAIPGGAAFFAEFDNG